MEHPEALNQDFNPSAAQSTMVLELAQLPRSTVSLDISLGT
jgi:hypothetical protein